MTPTHRQFCAALKSAREELSLSYRDACIDQPYGYNYLFGMERGRYGPSVRFVTSLFELYPHRLDLLVLAVRVRLENLPVSEERVERAARILVGVDDG